MNVFAILMIFFIPDQTQQKIDTTIAVKTPTTQTHNSSLSFRIFD